MLKVRRLTARCVPIRSDWRAGEGGGIAGVVVKCVEIGRNTSGGAGHLARLLTLRRDSVGSELD